MDIFQELGLLIGSKIQKKIKNKVVNFEYDLYNDEIG